MRPVLISAVLLAWAMVTLAQPGAAPRSNLLELANGAVLVYVSSTYGGSWSPLNLADGSTASGWCSAEGARFPHTIVFELPQRYAITSLAVDNTGDQESSYPGVSSKSVTVYGSTTSAIEGFTQLTAFEAPRGGRKEAKLGSPVTVQWLKFAASSNWGNTEYTEIMELEAYGQPIGQPPMVNVAGVYQTNYGAMRIEQDGASVSGCYDHDDGELSGELHGRVMQFEWRQHKGTRVGPAVMVLSVHGDALNGFWFEHGRLQGEWSGQRGGNPPVCAVARGDALATRLAGTGRAVLYGIYFDSDSAMFKPESEKTLREILAVLQAQPSLKLLIAGHTDSTNTDAHNLRLSQQRADAVVLWLVTHGVAPLRLTARGFGKSQPVADNATAAGRALNRRVELVTQ